MEQWVEYITEWSDWTEKDIGIIQADNLDIDKGIIIATAQTLYSRPEILEMIKDKIGVCIIDECHVVSAITFQSTIYKLKPKWCLGLSATAERDDGLSFLVTHAVGDIYFTSDREKMIKSGLIMKPIFRPIFLKRSKHYGNGKKFHNKTAEYRHVLEDFKKDEKVVHVISKIAYHHYKANDQILMIIKEEDYSWRFYEYILRNFIFTPEQVLYYTELNIQKWEEEIQPKINKINKKKWTDFLNQDEIDKTKKTVKKYGFKNFDVAVKKERKEELERDLEINKQKEIEELKQCKREWYMLDEVKKESKVVVIIGKTSKDERKDIIEKAKNKEYKIIITTKILDKAINFDVA